MESSYNQHYIFQRQKDHFMTSPLFLTKRDVLPSHPLTTHLDIILQPRLISDLPCRHVVINITFWLTLMSYVVLLLAYPNDVYFQLYGTYYYLISFQTYCIALLLFLLSNIILKEATRKCARLLTFACLHAHVNEVSLK